jgi:hypothetical protein
MASRRPGMRSGTICNIRGPCEPSMPNKAHTPVRPLCDVPRTSEPDSSTFAEYVDGLAELLSARTSPGRAAGVRAALDGEVSRRLRETIPLAKRRSEGAFFTGQALADRLLEGGSETVLTSSTIVDAACGAGDLLLRAARDLPLAPTVSGTLRDWGRRLSGRDLNPLYVRAARLRLALLASARLGRGWRGDDDALQELFPRITAGDGTELELEDPRMLMLINPPFGATVAEEPWGGGRIARAAVFTAGIVERLPAGATLRAILPDVLRTGSNYRRWRSHIEARLCIDRLEPSGQFDRWTDVDVFLLSGTAGPNTTPAIWWRAPSIDEHAATVADFFEVRVGTVVPHRDPKVGRDRPYLRANDLPQDGEHRPGGVRLAHSGRSFTPPLVVVRRTSRPDQSRSRVIATLVRGRESVYVENHLVVLRPHDHTVRSCQRLIETLLAPQTTEWLDQRLRCRHLTVRALREIPLPG